MDRRTGGFPTHARSLTSGPEPARRRRATWPRGIAAAVVVGLALAACSSSAATSTPVTAAATPAAAIPAAATPIATSSVLGVAQGPASAEPSLATGAPTSLDPCQLVTAAEASQLAGVSYTVGKESTTSGGGKVCTYGLGTADVFLVTVGQAPDKATAQAGIAEGKAALENQAKGSVQFIELPTFADGAAYYSGSVTAGKVTLNAGAFYCLKGLVFFGFSDVSITNPAPSLSALQAQATTILGRLP